MLQIPQPVVHLVWDEAALTIVPAPPELLKKLTLREKKLVCDKTTQWQRQMKVVPTPIYNTLSESPLAIQTYQGMWKTVKAFLEKKGYRVVLSDQRTAPLPAPRLDRMAGFRFSQCELLTKFLLHDCSGLVGAPTRYGKTTLLINTLKAYPGLVTVVTVPGADLVKQLYEQIKAACPRREVVLLGAGSRKRNPSEDITVCSMDSLHLCDKGRTELLLIDEPHAAVTNGRLHEINQFSKARRLGFGATLNGRFDGRDILIEGLIGPVLEERTYLEAVAEGAICPLSVIFLKVLIDRQQQCFKRDVAYNKFMFMNDTINSYVSRICKEIIPDKWQTLIFIKHENQADNLIQFVGEEGTIAMAKKLTSKQRAQMMEDMQSDSIKRCLATNIYAQGVTFPDIRAMINCEGGGNNTSAIQKPGRLAEIRPDKKRGIVVDFMFDTDPTIKPEDLFNYMQEIPGSEWGHIIRDSRARMKAYTDKGYEVIVAEDFDELKKLFEERM